MIGSGDGVVFDWEPTLTSAAELITAPRGTDARLDASRRPTRDQRRAEYFERMDAKAAARAADAAEREGGLWNEDAGTWDEAPEDEGVEDEK
jgi:GTP-binding protein